MVTRVAIGFWAGYHYIKWGFIKHLAPDKWVWPSGGKVFIMKFSSKRFAHMPFCPSVLNGAEQSYVTAEDIDENTLHKNICTYYRA